MAQISSPAIATQHTLPVSPMLNVLVIDSDLSVLEYITKACTHSSYQGNILLITISEKERFILFCYVDVCF